MQTNTEPTPTTVWILWFALLSSVAAYAVIGVFLRQMNGADAAAPDGIAVMRYALLGVAFAVTCINFLAPRLFGPKFNFMQFCIIRWALAEAVAIFGLVLIILGEELPVLLIFVAWSIALFMILAPTEGAKRRHDESRMSTPSIG
ncbi:MAG: hypothetical protein P9L99_04150 [Candidatus Lernaella stagnicola]|nr:hypothetical protein [Candidatus Lernaella stagnicola]